MKQLEKQMMLRKLPEPIIIIQCPRGCVGRLAFDRRGYFCTVCFRSMVASKPA